MAQENEGLDKIRHSIAHIMAEAVMELFPGAKIAIGPAIEYGFYYDFELPRTLRPEDLESIESRMNLIIAGEHPFEYKSVSREEAREIFKEQPYKLEIISSLPTDTEVTLYKQNNFVDLCKGPHVENTREIRGAAFKLLNIAGAYWLGDENKPMLQRIYGTAWANKKDLRKHLSWLKEVEMRDHRKLGKELDLFSTHEEAGAGLIYWHPKGARIRHIIEDFWKKEHFKNGYELLYTPHIGRSWLWKTSGHLDFFVENMYSSMEIDNQEYYLKPMNCPFHIMIYKTDIRSYRDLPLRWAELGTVYRYERSGVLHGLLRVRGFTQDDAHIICTPDQIDEEIREVLRFSLRMWDAFGFDKIKAYIATRPDKSVGEDNRWETAVNSLKKAIDAEGLTYDMDEGGGAFYGPKIDLKVKDALGREWQVSTIQFDFNLPERFNMNFVDHDGKEKRPFMVHRALFGSIERFFGVLIEHFGGAFPVWLAPIQVVTIPVAPAFNEYAKEVSRKLIDEGFRVENDLSDHRMNAKIRNAQTRKVPYMLILGEKERATNAVSLRTREGDQKNLVPFYDFVHFTNKKVDRRDLI